MGSTDGTKSGQTSPLGDAHAASNNFIESTQNSPDIKTRVMPPLTVNISEPPQKPTEARPQNFPNNFVEGAGMMFGSFAGLESAKDFTPPGAYEGGDLVSPKIRNKFIPSDPQQECAVCSGRASGKHFGAYTCESCKLFFLRILKIKNGAGRPLVCANSNKCPVTVNTRSMCRACRFQKCVEAGMAKEKCVYGRNARLIQNQQNGSGVGGGHSSPSPAGANSHYHRDPKLSSSSAPDEYACSPTVTSGGSTYHHPSAPFNIPSHRKMSASGAMYPKIRIPVSTIPSVIKSYKVMPSSSLIPGPTNPHNHMSKHSPVDMTYPVSNHLQHLPQGPPHNVASNEFFPGRFGHTPYPGMPAPGLVSTAPPLTIPIPAPPSLIPSTTRVIPIPPPPLVVPSQAVPKTTLPSSGAIPIPKLIAYHLENPFAINPNLVPTSHSGTTRDQKPLVRRPPESEKNSPKSENSDDSGYCQTDSSYEDQNRGWSQHQSRGPKHPKLSATTVLGTRNNEGNQSNSSLSSGRSEDSSSSGDDSPPRFNVALRAHQNNEKHALLLSHVYLHRDVDKDYFPELPMFQEDISSDTTLTTRFKATQHENELALAVIMTKLTPDENIRLENWVELFEEYGKNWLPCLIEQIEQFKSKHIHISLLEFDCQFLLSTYIPKNLSFRPLVTSQNVTPEALKPILFGSIFGLNLPVHHFVCKGNVRFPKVVSEMLKVECRVIKTLKLLDLSELELALITNYLSLKTFRRHLPFVCTTEMRREESFMDNIFITVMEVNKRERLVRAIHLVCEFTLAKSDVFFKFLQSGTDEIC